MKTHEATVQIAKSEIDRINRLLSIESLEDMTASEMYEYGANTHQNENIFSVKFDNGSSLSFELCSGLHNYWDDVVWTSPDGKRDVVLDCEYAIDDIEVEIEGELYVVKLKKVEQNEIWEREYENLWKE